MAWILPRVCSYYKNHGQFLQEATTHVIHVCDKESPIIEKLYFLEITGEKREGERERKPESLRTIAFRGKNIHHDHESHQA
jgi:hypothetical protein